MGMCVCAYLFVCKRYKVTRTYIIITIRRRARGVDVFVFSGSRCRTRVYYNNMVSPHKVWILHFLDDYASPHHHQLVRVTQIDNDFQKRLYLTCNAYVAHNNNISMMPIIVRSITYNNENNIGSQWLEPLKNRDSISKILVFFFARSDQNIDNPTNITFWIVGNSMMNGTSMFQHICK